MAEKCAHKGSKSTVKLLEPCKCPKTTPDMISDGGWCPSIVFCLPSSKWYKSLATSYCGDLMFCLAAKVHKVDARFVTFCLYILCGNIRQTRNWRVMSSILAWSSQFFLNFLMLKFSFQKTIWLQVAGYLCLTLHFKIVAHTCRCCIWPHFESEGICYSEMPFSTISIHKVNEYC